MSPTPAIRGWLSGADRRRLVYYAVLSAYVCSWVFVASGYRPDTRLLPVTLALALLAGICLRAIGAWFLGDEEDHSTHMDAPDPTAESTVDARSAAVAFAWLSALVGAVLLFGLLGGVWTFVTAFVTRYEGYRRGLIVGSGTVLFVLLLFVGLLDLPTLDPYALRLLERGGVLGG